jgi:hypothetical protein
MAAKQHATAKAVMMAEEQRTYVQEPRSMTACTLGSEVSAALPR